jgi:seryl-tRNA synthetase
VPRASPPTTTSRCAAGARRGPSTSPKDHTDIGEGLGLLDFATAAKIAGARFSFLRGTSPACIRARPVHARHPWHASTATPSVYTPYIVNAERCVGTDAAAEVRADMFCSRRAARTAMALYLISTVRDHAHQHRARRDPRSRPALPIRLTAHTPCFRSEAGSYGKDTRGMIRQHQFDKVELVQIVPRTSRYEAHEELTGHAETILQLLDLPYRRDGAVHRRHRLLVGQDLRPRGVAAGQSAYREISSCSNCEAFQARRMQARFRNAQGKPELVHTLNGSGLAVGRTLVAVLENYQHQHSGRPASVFRWTSG